MIITKRKIRYIVPSDIVDSYLSKYALMEGQRRASLIIDRRTDPKGRKVSRLSAKVHLAGSENTCTLPVLLLALLKTCQLFKSLSLYSCSAHVQCRLLFLTERSSLLFFVFHMIIFLHYVFACRFVFLLFKESPTGEIACTSARSLHSFLCSFVVRLATSPEANAMQRHDKSCFESCSNSRH